MLQDLILDKKANVGIIGLGYVGLPLALQIMKKGFPVIGVDINKKRVAQINQGRSFIDDVESRALKNYVQTKKLRATSDYRHLRKCDVIIICIPRPWVRLSSQIITVATPHFITIP